MDSTLLQQKLAKSAKLANYFAYVTLIMVGLRFLLILFDLFFGKGVSVWSIFTFLIQTIITVIVAMMLLKYSKLSSQYLATGDKAFFTLALTQLKNFFTILGVFFIIIVVLLALTFLLSIIVMIFKK